MERVSLAPNRFDVCGMRAYAWILAGQPERSLGDYNVYLRHYPRDALSLQLRAQIEQKLGEYRHDDRLLTASRQEYAALKAPGSSEDN